VAQDGRLLTRETVDGFQEKSSASLEKFNTDSTDSIDHFKAHSTDNLETAQNELEILSARFRQDLERSEDLVTDNEKVNEISTALSEKTTDLNATTTHLHEKCGELIGEINGAINTINLANEKLNKESVALQQQSSNLNDETRKLHKNSLVINDQSLSIQKESVSTQELSQEINSHSLSLHEEARLVSLDFDRLNTENREMIHELVELKIQLTQQSVQIRDQQFDCRETTETAENLNRTSSTLNVETQLLNHQTLETLKDAEHTITKTERLNKASIALAEEIRDAQKKLVLVGADVQGASNAARKATAEAERSTARSQQIQETLITSVSEMEDLKQDTEEELSHLQKIKDDAIEDFESSKEAQKQLQLCINESRQINNEFMLGLEVAQDSHQHTNDHANAILEKCKGLQTEIRSLLSVANGIDEFQSNIDRCQHRLDQYSDNLASCHNTTSAHTELLDECQTRIDEYQGEIQQCRESVTLMDSRAKRLEGYFSGYEKRLNILETNQDNSLEDSFNEQVLKMRALETDIRTGFRNNQERLEQNLSKLKSSLDSRFATLGEELMRRVGKEIETRNEPIHKKIDVTNKTMSNLSTSFEELNRSITSEVNKLREESLEVRRQNRDLQVKNQSVRREHNETISKQGHEIQELKNRLRNYQTLLQTQIDTSSTNILDDRIDDLESSVKSQQQILESHASFNVEISDTVNDESKQMNVMVNKFGRSMEDAIETNKTLKVEIETARKTNRQLASANEQLQEQMQSSLEKRDVIMQDYSDRLGGMEHRERGYLTTIDDLKSHETDTNLGMHQMLLALKESTEAMKDTQKTLEKYKDHGVSRSLDKPQGMTWLGSSKQAVVSVLCAVAFTGLTMFGYQKVDASVNETHDNLVASATKFNPLDSMPFQRLDTAESSLQSISRASSSIALLGTFSWPVNVGIVDPNDIRYQPHRRGISISAELGDPVVSVNDGTVIYSADEIRGYGNVIVIQHDENLVSVYANNQYNYVQKGDKVRRGQLIGDVGLLFNQDEAGLYFEIRYMGTPEDPFNYLGHSIESSLLDLAIQ
jgi:murein DD-endopeptidase MepM/ murein hydrolase activator NlpD